MDGLCSGSGSVVAAGFSSYLRLHQSKISFPPIMSQRIVGMIIDMTVNEMLLYVGVFKALRVPRSYAEFIVAEINGKNIWSLWEQDSDVQLAVS